MVLWGTLDSTLNTAENVSDSRLNIAEKVADSRLNADENVSDFVRQQVERS